MFRLAPEEFARASRAARDWLREITSWNFQKVLIPSRNLEHQSRRSSLGRGFHRARRKWAPQTRHRRLSRRRLDARPVCLELSVLVASRRADRHVEPARTCIPERACAMIDDGARVAGAAAAAADNSWAAALDLGPASDGAPAQRANLEWPPMLTRRGPLDWPLAFTSLASQAARFGFGAFRSGASVVFIVVVVGGAAKRDGRRLNPGANTPARAARHRLGERQTKGLATRRADLIAD